MTRATMKMRPQAIYWSKHFSGMRTTETRYLRELKPQPLILYVLLHDAAFPSHDAEIQSFEAGTVSTRYHS